MNEPATFGNLLKRHRQAAGLTQEELAERAGLTAQAISTLERGTRRSPHRDTIDLLAEGLALAAPERLAFENAARRRGLLAPTATPDQVGTTDTLPAQPTPMIGRAGDISVLVRLLRRRLHSHPDRAEVRLLTLTGPGGVGKSRLAIALAAELHADFVDSVHFVALAGVHDHRLVLATIATSLGLREQTGYNAVNATLSERLIAYLRDRQLLVVLDNIEHILAAAPQIAALLAGCPGLSILATGRAPLHLRAEQEFPVAPLGVPPATSQLSLESLAAYPAVTLFVGRARAVQPDFTLTTATAPVVLEICRKLDGLPLAIELAAARLKLLPPRALQARLDDRLGLLTGGARDLPSRQQTLRGAIAWSYELLRPAEQALFRQLAIFAGGCTVEAAEAVCVLTAEAEYTLLDGLASLVDNNLLRRQAVSDETPDRDFDDDPRFAMLETIRDYGLASLALSTESSALRERHAAYFLALAERSEPDLLGPAQATALNRLAREHDNLRAALEWALQGGEPELGLRLAGALWRYWFGRGHLTEGRAWLEKLLGAAGPGLGMPEAERRRAKALYGAGALAYHQGDYAGSAAYCEDSLARYEALGDVGGIATALNGLAIVARTRGDHPKARAWQELSLALQRERKDTRGIAAALNNLGEMARQHAEFGRATALYSEALALFRELGDRRHEALALHNLGRTAIEQGEYARAEPCYTGGLALFRELGDQWGVALGLGSQATAAHHQGEGARARALYEESLALFRDLGDDWGIGAMLGGLAELAYDEGDQLRAATLGEEYLALARSREDTFAMAGALRTLGAVACEQGSAARATVLLREGLTLSQRLGDRVGVAESLESLAWVTALQDRHGRAVQLYALAATLRAQIGSSVRPVARPVNERRIAVLAARLGEQIFAASWAAGTTLQPDTVLAETAASRA